MIINWLEYFWQCTFLLVSPIEKRSFGSITVTLILKWDFCRAFTKHKEARHMPVMKLDSWKFNVSRNCVVMWYLLRSVHIFLAVLQTCDMCLFSHKYLTWKYMKQEECLWFSDMGNDVQISFLQLKMCSTEQKLHSLNISAIIKWT